MLKPVRHFGQAEQIEAISGSGRRLPANLDDWNGKVLGRQSINLLRSSWTCLAK